MSAIAAAPFVAAVASQLGQPGTDTLPPIERWSQQTLSSQVFTFDANGTVDRCRDWPPERTLSLSVPCTEAHKRVLEQLGSKMPGGPPTDRILIHRIEIGTTDALATRLDKAYPARKDRWVDHVSVSVKNGTAAQCAKKGEGPAAIAAATCDEKKVAPYCNLLDTEECAGSFDWRQVVFEDLDPAMQALGFDQRLNLGLGAATPEADLRSIFSSDDYPSAALRTGQQGTVRARLVVDVDGAVTDCVVLQSSGAPMLDEKTCSVLKARAQFGPGKDEAGNPVESEYISPPITWNIPVPRRAPLARTEPPRNLKPILSFRFDAAGEATQCAIWFRLPDGELNVRPCVEGAVQFASRLSEDLLGIGYRPGGTYVTWDLWGRDDAIDASVDHAFEELSIVREQRYDLRIEDGELTECSLTDFSPRSNSRENCRASKVPPPCKDAEERGYPVCNFIVSYRTMLARDLSPHADKVFQLADAWQEASPDSDEEISVEEREEMLSARMRERFAWQGLVSFRPGPSGRINACAFEPFDGEGLGEPKQCDGVHFDAARSAMEQRPELAEASKRIAYFGQVLIEDRADIDPFTKNLPGRGDDLRVREEFSTLEPCIRGQACPAPGDRIAGPTALQLSGTRTSDAIRFEDGMVR